MGFSQKMCLPAFAAAMVNLAWVSVDEQMRTASMACSQDRRRIVCGNGNAELRGDLLGRRR